MNLNSLINKEKIDINNIKYKINKIKEKQDLVVLYLDNNEKISISIESYFKYELSSIKGLDIDTYNKLKDEETVLLGYMSCLRKLSIKDYSIKQINDYLLTKRKLNIEDVKLIIEKLINYGLLDDDKYAVNRINYLNNQLMSFKQIKYKLLNEGIGNNLIEKYVIINNEDEYNKALKLTNKYAYSIKNKSTNAIKKTILSKLVNSGYSYDIASNALNSIEIVNEKECELLVKEFNKVKAKYVKKYEGYELNSHIYSYLVNKGYKSSDIKKVMEENNE